jgi:glycerophosphoryl diester phosphodiesterase
MEIDVAISADRNLFVFHPGMEFAHLRSSKSIKDMTSSEVSELRFVNQDGVPTEHKVSLLDEVFDLFKGRCIINVDKFWTAMPEITACIRRHGMEDQVIVKTSADEKWFSMVEEIAPELPYMPIIGKKDTFSEGLLKRKINFIGAEVLFYTESDETCSESYVSWMHDHDLLLWANAIVYNSRVQLAAGHSDDISIVGRQDEGWGWLVEKGYDIIQTDWMLPCREYFKLRGMKVREM